MKTLKLSLKRPALPLLLTCVLLLSGCAAFQAPKPAAVPDKPMKMDHDMSGMKHDMPGMEHDMSGMEHDMSGMKHDMPGMEHDMSGMHHHHEVVDGNYLKAGVMPSQFGGPYQAMNAIGSGTSLMPADSPAYMWHFGLFDDQVSCMAHGELKLSYDNQGGPRGVSRFQSQNWLMGSCNYSFSSDAAVQVRAMLTAEPFTSPSGGFPQLFQTGETYHGRDIVDAQHPHNLFSELSVAFTQKLSENLRYYVYFGLPGDREEGPTAFMHRMSALENPAVPLCHHCQDAGHITNGVVSAGMDIGKVRIGGSFFRGREPGENRLNIQPGGFDSYSARIQYAPTENWVLGASYGRVHNAEIAQPGDMDRYTAFAQYSKRYEDGYLAVTGVLGHNKDRYGTLSGALLEGTLNFQDVNYLYSRAECVNKPGLSDMNIYGKPGLETEMTGLSATQLAVSGMATSAASNSTVCAFTAGYARDVYTSDVVRVGLGFDLTGYIVPGELKPIYGDNPMSFMLNLRIRPGRVY